MALRARQSRKIELGRLVSQDYVGRRISIVPNVIDTPATRSGSDHTLSNYIGHVPVLSFSGVGNFIALQWIWRENSAGNIEVLPDGVADRILQYYLLLKSYRNYPVVYDDGTVKRYGSIKNLGPYTTIPAKAPRTTTALVRYAERVYFSIELEDIVLPQPFRGQQLYIVTQPGQVDPDGYEQPNIEVPNAPLENSLSETFNCVVRDVVDVPPTREHPAYEIDADLNLGLTVEFGIRGQVTANVTITGDIEQYLPRGYALLDGHIWSIQSVTRLRPTKYDVTLHREYELEL